MNCLKAAGKFFNIKKLPPEGGFEAKEEQMMI